MDHQKGQKDDKQPNTSPTLPATKTSKLISFAQTLGAATAPITDDNKKKVPEKTDVIKKTCFLNTWLFFVSLFFSASFFFFECDTLHPLILFFSNASQTKPKASQTTQSTKTSQSQKPISNQPKRKNTKESKELLESYTKSNPRRKLRFFFLLFPITWNTHILLSIIFLKKEEQQEEKEINWNKTFSKESFISTLRLLRCDELQILELGAIFIGKTVPQLVSLILEDSELTNRHKKFLESYTKSNPRRKLRFFYFSSFSYYLKHPYFIKYYFFKKEEQQEEKEINWNKTFSKESFMSTLRPLLRNEQQINQLGGMFIGKTVPQLVSLIQEDSELTNTYKEFLELYVKSNPRRKLRFFYFSSFSYYYLKLPHFIKYYFFKKRRTTRREGNQLEQNLFKREFYVYSSTFTTQWTTNQSTWGHVHRKNCTTTCVINTRRLWINKHVQRIPWIIC